MGIAASIVLVAACSAAGPSSTGGDPDGAPSPDGSAQTATDGAGVSDAKPADAAATVNADANVNADADAGGARCNTVIQTAPTPVRAIAPPPIHQGGAITPGRYHLLRETSQTGFDELRATTWVVGSGVIESRGVKPSNPTGTGEITSYSFVSSGIDLDLTFTCLGPGNAGLGQKRMTNYTATPTTLTLTYLPSGYTVELELQP